MRRKFMFVMVLIIILLGMLSLTFGIHSIKAESGTRFAYNVRTYEAPKTTILILVNETIYTKIVDQLTIFEQDLASDGYDTIVSTLSNGITPPEIKAMIKSYYVESNINGCILIGDIKAAYSEIRTGDYSNSSALKIWISLDAMDMYYMDLDGYWENITHPDFYAYMPSNVVEVHLYPSCETFYNEYIVYLNETKKWDYGSIENKTQYRAEIWVSRIMGHNLSIPGKDEADIVNEFLYWDHTFRTEQTQIEDRVYLMNAIGSGYNDQNMNYSGIFNSIIKKEYVTKNDYLNCLENPNGSKLIYLTAHSWPQGHMLYDTSLTVGELADSNKTSVFYILNACSACRWDQYVTSPTSPNYLGGIYVFDKNEEDHGLGAIGFTGVGGFNWLEFFTDYLSANPNASYGEAYKYWFNENLMRIFGTTNYVYLGDPIIGPRTPKLPIHNLNTGLNYTTIQEAIDAPETLDGHTIFVDKGIYYEHLVVKKSLSLIGERSSITIINGSGAYATIVHVIADNVSIGGFTIRNGQDYPGIYVENSSHCVIKDNTFIDINYYAVYTVNADYSLIKANNFSSSSGNWGRGIQLRYSDNSTITGNQIMTHNDQYCIWLHNSSDCNIYDNWLADAEDGLMIEHSYSCLVKKNVIENCERGIDIGWWVGGEFVENLIKSNYYGVEGEGSLQQYPQYPKWIFYHNNFVNNTHQAYVSSGEGSWDNTGEGNYWDDYSGVDSNYDGIGDSPYSIEHAPNKDNHPLIGMFHSFNTSYGYAVSFISNSSISSFSFNLSNIDIYPPEAILTFNVSGVTDTEGFVRVCIPKTLINSSYVIRFNGEIITDTTYPQVKELPCSNETYTYFYINYTHSEYRIEISGITTIPVFPSFLILPIFMLATLLIVIVYRRKHVV